MRPIPLTWRPPKVQGLVPTGSVIVSNGSVAREDAGGGPWSGPTTPSVVRGLRDGLSAPLSTNLCLALTHRRRVIVVVFWPFQIIVCLPKRITDFIPQREKDLHDDYAVQAQIGAEQSRGDLTK